MGLLDIVNRQQLPAQPLLGGATEGLGLLWDTVKRAVAGLDKKNKAISKAWDKPNDEQAQRAAYQATMDFAGLAPLGLTVWHGSPHKFDRFDMSKIGTGEGAQAYGHGLYVAEAPEVAGTYLNPAGRTKISIDGGNAIEAAYKDKSISSAIRYLQDYGDIEQAIKYAKEYGDLSAAAKIQELQNAGRLAKPEGALYKVDIPDEAVARMLDWDKPLSQQAPEVQQAVKSLAKHTPEGGMYRESMAPYEFGNLTGQQIERIFASDVASGGNGQANKTFSMLASEYGIPGIRYLDGGSRGAGGGTSNYVLFSDKLPRILERNGQPTGLLPWGKGEWKGLLD